MKKLSVIVPGYNVEKYISKCIDSILKNKIKGMEIILVNDGSKDNTLSIMREYEEKYPKLIRVIDQENQGISMARNAGIENASGEYISFIDSDDYIEPNMYHTMLEKAKTKDFDVVTCDVNVIYPDHTLRVTSGVDHDCLTKKAVKQIMNTWYAVTWNKIYKRELLKEMRFKKDVWYEDVEFLYRLIPHVKKVGVVDQCLYNYIQRENSITYTYNKKLYHLIENMNGIIDYYKEHKYYANYKDELEYAYVRYAYATFIKRLAKSKNKEMFKQGVTYAIKEVNNHFPEYKKNPYLKKGLKNYYLKKFNPFIANMIYFIEKDKMN